MKQRAAFGLSSIPIPRTCRAERVIPSKTSPSNSPRFAAIKFRAVDDIQPALASSNASRLHSAAIPLALPRPFGF